MTNTVSINVPSSVSMRIQGKEFSVTTSDIPADALAAMFAYGVRRKYQDSTNSAAKAIRDEGGKPDADALFSDFHKRVLDDALGVRGESVTSDPLDKYRRAIVRDLLARDKDGKGWKAYAAIDASDRKARDAFLLAIATKNKSKIDPLAQTELDKERAAAKRLASLGDDLEFDDMLEDPETDEE